MSYCYQKSLKEEILSETFYSFGPLPIIRTDNPINRLYNPIQIQLQPIIGHNCRKQMTTNIQSWLLGSAPLKNIRYSRAHHSEPFVQPLFLATSWQGHEAGLSKWTGTHRGFRTSWNPSPFSDPVLTSEPFCWAANSIILENVYNSGKCVALECPQGLKHA